MIHEWRVLSKSPSESAWIMWIDNDSEGADHTFRWGEDDVSDNTETVSEPDELKPLDDAYVYSIEVDDLSPSTDYVCEIEGESETVEQTFRTLTDEPFEDGLTIGQISDIHPWRGDYYMDDIDPDGEVMQDLAAEDIDLLLVTGDFPTTRHDCVGTDEAETLLDYFGQYHHHLNDHQIVPIMMSIGNHEWGYQYDPFEEEPEPGVGCDDDIAYYYETLFPNVIEYADGYEFDEDENAGYDYNCEISIGDLQILAQDPVTQKPWDVADWTEDVIRDDAEMILPLNHYGMWCTRSHDQMEPHSYGNRSYLLPVYDGYPVRFAFTGHQHGRGITEPYHYSAEEPGGTENEDWEELDDEGYVAIDPNADNPKSIIEFGSGWPTMRGGDTDDKWAYSQLSGSDYENHYILTVENPSITVEERDANGTTQNEIEFGTEGSINYAGDVATVTLRNCTLRNGTL